MQTEKEVLDWSGAVDIKDIGIVSFQIRDKKGSQSKFMKMEIRSDRSLLYVIIEEIEGEKNAQYILENNLPEEFGMLYNQKELKHFQSTLKSKQKTLFAWDDPINNRELEIWIQSPNLFTNFIILLEKINSKNELLLKEDVVNDTIRKKSILCKVVLEGEAKKLLIGIQEKSIPLKKKGKYEEKKRKGMISSEKEAKTLPSTEPTKELEGPKKQVSKEEEKKVPPPKAKGSKEQKKPSIKPEEKKESALQSVDEKEAKIHRKIIFQFKAVGLSVISNSKEKSLEFRNKKRSENRELFYLYLHHIDFVLIEDKKLRDMQLKILFMNLDNCSDSLLIFPVVFTPSQNQQILQDKKKSCLNIIVSQNYLAKNVRL